MEEKDPKEDLRKVSLFEFRHNLGLLIDTRYNPLGLQVSHIEHEYSFWFPNSQTVNLERLETHEKSWIGLFKNEKLMKDRFFVATKNSAQYVRSNPDKLAAESKELFDFANYNELERRRKKREDKTTQTDSKYPNLMIVQQEPTHIKSIHDGFMHNIPVTPPQDDQDDPKTTTTTDSTRATDERRHSEISGRRSSDASSQHSTESASTDFLDEVSTKVHDGLKNKIKIKKEPLDIVTSVLPEFKIEPEEPFDNADVLETAPIEHMDEETWPSSTQSTNTQPRVETTSHYAGDDEYGTIPKAPGFHEGLAFQERDFPADDYGEPGPSDVSPVKRKLENASYYSEDYCIGTTLKSPRYHEPQRLEKDNLHSNVYMECTNNYFDYSDQSGTVAQNDKFTRSSAAGLKISEHQLADQFPKSMQGLVGTGIKMAENLLKQLTELVNGVRSAKRLKSASPKSAVKERWMAFPLQDKGLGIYLSDGDGTPFFWNAERWDPNIFTPNPGRPLSMKLPPNSLLYGEFIEVSHTFGKLHTFTEFNVIDIAALEGRILKGGFSERRAKCTSYLAETQGTETPKIYMAMKPCRSLQGVKSWKILRDAYARKGAFHLDRSKTSLEIAAIGLIQLCPERDASGSYGFSFSMNRRYNLKAPDPSRKPSLDKYVLKEFSKIFKDMDS